MTNGSPLSSLLSDLGPANLSYCVVDKLPRVSELAGWYCPNAFPSHSWSKRFYAIFYTDICLVLLHTEI